MFIYANPVPHANKLSRWRSCSPSGAGELCLGAELGGALPPTPTSQAADHHTVARVKDEGMGAGLPTPRKYVEYLLGGGGGG
jgi:hypothetical protein